MRVLFTASECTPFIKTGGLADVAGSLPRALSQQDNTEASVILPYYMDIPAAYKQAMKELGSFIVPVGWRRQQATLLVLEHESITYYFIRNDHYFGRHGAYGYFDDGERFVFFSRAVVEALAFLPFIPDIVHSHDWQTGLVPALLKILQPLPDVKSIFTIHNLQYQGAMPGEMFYELLNLGPEHFYGFEWKGGLNCLKAAIYHADKITTVSPSYADEVKTAYYGEGLDPLLRERSHDFSGIVNGIDEDSFHPEKDGYLNETYLHSPSAKKKNKTSLQKELGLPVNPDIPMIVIISRLADQKGLSLVTYLIDEIMAEGFQMAVLGTGDQELEHALGMSSTHFTEQLAVRFYFDEGLARRMYAGADFFLMPSRFEPCGLGQLIALRYETAPIVRETGGLRDTVFPFNEHTGEGNGFSFTNFNAHDMLNSIRYAKRIYEQPEHLQALYRNIYASSVGWDQSAEKYLSLYAGLLR
ncbi:glycogen synthase [Alteribacillus sp. HJP-4]|uniref:glycogen synthase n=1 Tax=Alteribacillus sp. HJP-4 TaxID=2775394 RepID=UPI0035CCD3BA